MPDKKKILIITCGLMGSGKSRIASALAAECNLVLLRSDEVRKELAGINVGEHRYEPFGGGIYSAAFFDRTYDALFKRAAEFLNRGESVIIDASFKKRGYREQAKKLAEEKESFFLLLETVCPDEEIKARLQERVSIGRDVSDGRLEIFERQKGDFEAVSELSAKEHVQLNTKASIEENLNRVVEAIERVSM